MVQLGLYRDDLDLFNEGLDLWSSIMDNMLKWGSEPFTLMRIPQPNMTLLEDFFLGNSSSNVAEADERAKKKSAKLAAAIAAAELGLNNTLGQAAGAALMAGDGADLRSAAAAAGLVGAAATTAATEQGNGDGGPGDADKAQAAGFFQRLLDGGLLRLGKPAVVVERRKGETVETLRDFFHAQFGLGGLLQVAELAWQQVRWQGC
jgi:hypothetical protein